MSKKLGNIIKEARTAKGLSQAALAEQVGISSTEVGKIERGEKEPSQDVLKLMAKPLGVTQKSLLEAASGTGTAAGGKTSSAKKPSSGKTSTAGKTSTTGKTSSSAKKPASAKKPSSSKTDASVGTLTATEKKLVTLYRKADSNTKKAAMKLLSGDGSAMDIIGPMVLGNSDISSMASGLFGSLLSGKKELRSIDPETLENPENLENPDEASS